MSRKAKMRKAKIRIRKIYCVIGYPIGHSLSPQLHNRAFRKLKIPAQYEAVEVQPRDLAKFMRGYREKYAGGNVTIPHKQAVMKYLDRISPEAKKIGAVNTIVNLGGKLMGYNTDVYGAMEALKPTSQINSESQKSRRHAQTAKVRFLNGQKVTVLGAGGAARAVVYGLKKAGARVMILNRTLAHAKKLAQEFGCAYAALEDFQKCSACGFDMLINATSVGMWRSSRRRRGNNGAQAKTPLPSFKNFFVLGNGKKSPIVMDIIYRPRITQFLRDAKRAGCKIITGDRMFLAQAAKSFELWTGMRPKFPKL